MRVAALDCGSNATRLLVADVRGGRVHEVLRTLRLTRMAKGLDASGVIDRAALARVGDALRSHLRQARTLGAQRVGVLATQAAREAGNTEDLVAVVVDTAGVRPDVLSGDEEAARTHAGALTDLPVDRPALVVDLGGGSTELALEVAGGLRVRSTPLGAVRLRERHLTGGVPTSAQVTALVVAVTRELDSMEGWWWSVPRSVVAVGGTALALAAMHQRIADADAVSLHGAATPADVVSQLAEDLVWEPAILTAARAQVEPARADVIGVGALVLALVVRRTAARELVTSRHDLLDDLARRLAAA